MPFSNAIRSLPSIFRQKCALSGMGVSPIVGNWIPLPQSIANAIVREREKQPIETTLQLVDIIRNAVPAAASRQTHPARRTFQALRIYVNGELDGLGKAVEDMFSCLNEGGRLSIITFHSLEDKTVKQVFASLTQGCICPKDFPVCVCGRKPQAKVLKPVVPEREETEKNPRAPGRSFRREDKYSSQSSPLLEVEDAFKP